MGLNVGQYHRGPSPLSSLISNQQQQQALHPSMMSHEQYRANYNSSTFPPPPQHHSFQSNTRNSPFSSSSLPFPQARAGHLAHPQQLPFMQNQQQNYLPSPLNYEQQQHRMSRFQGELGRGRPSFLERGSNYLHPQQQQIQLQNRQQFVSPSRKLFGRETPPGLLQHVPPSPSGPYRVPPQPHQSSRLGLDQQANIRQTLYGQSAISSSRPLSVGQNNWRSEGDLLNSQFPLQPPLYSNRQGMLPSGRLQGIPPPDYRLPSSDYNLRSPASSLRQLTSPISLYPQPSERHQLLGQNHLLYPSEADQLYGGRQRQLHQMEGQLLDPLPLPVGQQQLQPRHQQQQLNAPLFTANSAVLPNPNAPTPGSAFFSSAAPQIRAKITPTSSSITKSAPNLSQLLSSINPSPIPSPAPLDADHHHQQLLRQKIILEAKQPTMIRDKLESKLRGLV